MMQHKVFLRLFFLLLTTRMAQAQQDPFALRITFGYTDAEVSQWTGRVRDDDARLATMEGWRFLGPDSISLNTFDIQTSRSLAKGVVLTGTASTGSRIRVVTNHGAFSFPLSDLKLGEGVEFLGGAARVERLPDAVKLTRDSQHDDYPSIAVSGDSTVWAVWQSYTGQQDEVRVSKHDGVWKTFTRLPGASGDVWRPQVALDHRDRPTVVWSQQIKGNFDLYARTLDEDSNTWLKSVRLSSHPYPDIDHHLIADHQGHLWVVWQGFRGDNSDIFLRYFNGSGWSEEIRLTEHPGNDWEPRVAVDNHDKAYVVWDTYRDGNYDVYMRTYQEGYLGPLIPVADTPRFEAHASVAVDRQGRVWVAWEESGPNWGKDRGVTIDPEWRGNTRDESLKHSAGMRLYESRNINLVVFEGATRKRPVSDLGAALSSGGDAYDSPQLLIDSRSNRVGLLFHRRGRTPNPYQGPGATIKKPSEYAYWETAVTFYEGESWSPVLAMPQSWDRISARPAGAYGPDGSLWLIWPTDGRLYIESLTPVAENVYSANIRLDEAPDAAVLKAWESPEEIPVRVVHPNEREDLKAIRSYRTFVHGVEQRVVRGDLHRHTELSWDDGGRLDGSLFDFYRYMLDAGGFDFGAVTDHLSGGGYDYWAWLIEKSCDLYNIPRTFTTLYAYERSARFPNGHRNIFHTKRGIPMVRFFTQAGFAGPEPGIDYADLVENDTKLLFESLRETGGISIPHSSTSSIMGTDWRDNDPAVEPVVEIFQGFRTSAEYRGAPRAPRSDEDQAPGGFQEAGLLWNAYAKGYRLGTIASSDHHSTHISYAMVYTEQPTREAIFEAIRKRHTYGATDNIVLDYRMGEHFMGEEFTASSVPPVKIRIVGTSRVVQVDIIKNEAIIYSTSPNRKTVSLTYVDQNITAGTSYYYVRVLQDDRQIAWSSPIWVNYQP